MLMKRCLNCLKRVILKVMECFILGFQHVESTVTALVDIIHAFAIADPSKVGLAVKQYVKMLLCEVGGPIINRTFSGSSMKILECLLLFIP